MEQKPDGVAGKVRDKLVRVQCRGCLELHYLQSAIPFGFLLELFKDDNRTRLVDRPFEATLLDRRAAEVLREHVAKKIVSEKSGAVEHEAKIDVVDAKDELERWLASRN